MKKGRTLRKKGIKLRQETKVGGKDINAEGGDIEEEEKEKIRENDGGSALPVFRESETESIACAIYREDSYGGAVKGGGGRGGGAERENE